MTSRPTPDSGAPDIGAQTTTRCPKCDTYNSPSFDVLCQVCDTPTTTEGLAMSLKDKLFGRDEDVQASRDADAALHRYSDSQAHLTEEDPEYQRLNERANETAGNLPWWRR